MDGQGLTSTPWTLVYVSGDAVLAGVFADIHPRKKIFMTYYYIPLVWAVFSREIRLSLFSLDVQVIGRAARSESTLDIVSKLRFPR